MNRILKADAKVGCLEQLTEELSKFSALWQSMEKEIPGGILVEKQKVYKVNMWLKAKCGLLYQTRVEPLSGPNKRIKSHSLRDHCTQSARCHK